MLRYMTAGESHGRELIAIIDGVPAGLSMGKDEKAFIDEELKRRMFGYGRGGRMAIEDDKAEIVAGVRKGRTIGSPVGIVVKNKDHKIDELPDVRMPRPGHADLAGIRKYGLGDARDVLERASARKSAATVAAGAVAKLILRELGIDILSHVTMIGGVRANVERLSFEGIRSYADGSKSRLRCADREAEEKMVKAIDDAKDKGDTLGGEFEVIARGVPPGLGTYVQWDRRLDGALARAVMSIPAVKAVSVGDGVENASRSGSEVHDPIEYDKGTEEFTRSSNRAGGIEGGVSNGEDIIVRGFMKPIATLLSPLPSVDIDTKEAGEAATERSDVTAVPACGVVAEAAVAIEIVSALLDKFGADSMRDIKCSYECYRKRLKEI